VGSFYVAPPNKVTVPEVVNNPTADGRTWADLAYHEPAHTAGDVNVTGLPHTEPEEEGQVFPTQSYYDGGTNTNDRGGLHTDVDREKDFFKFMTDPFADTFTYHYVPQETPIPQNPRDELRRRSNGRARM